MEITGLDITLQRISMIEQQFQRLSGDEINRVNQNFQKILDSTMSNPTDKMGEKYSGRDVSKDEINKLIDEYAEKAGLDADFVRAVVKQESGFNERAKSRCGAAGLMQLMPATAKSLGVVDSYNAEQNIYGGTKYLKGLMDRFGGNKELALAAYNAGPNAVKKYHGIPPYQETQRYVKNVLSIYNKYKGDA